jgi:superfamily II DNA or RNA helicase
MNRELRDYQRRWCRKVWDAFTKGISTDAGSAPQRFTRLLATAATGAGKTVMASALIWAAIQKLNAKCVFLADSDDLIEQAAKGIHGATGLIPSIEKAEQHAGRRSHNVVASIQTMSQPKRLETWDPNHFQLVIADEAHLSMADSWQRVLSHFNQDGRGAWILGVTATPERADGKDLFDFYEHLADEVGLFELIDAGFLAPITVETVPLNIDCTGARIQENYGDDGNQMEEAIEPFWDQIIEQWKRRATGRRTIIFHPGIRASKRFTERLQHHGISARHIDGNTKDRAEILAEFQRGDFDVLNNAQLLQKGFDCPPISCVVILRPTNSRVAYQQMVGRGTRLSEGKTDCLLLDFFWHFEGKMKPIGPADLVTRDPRRRDGIASMFRGDDGAKINLGAASQEYDREQTKNFIARLREAASKGRGMRFDAREIGVAFGQPELVNYVPTSNWERGPATDRQKEALKKAGVLISNVKTKGEASAILDFLAQRRAAGACTIKQAAALMANGIDAVEAASADFSGASALLSQIMTGTGRRP